MKDILEKAKGILKSTAWLAPVTITMGVFIGLTTSFAVDQASYHKKNDEFLKSETVTQQVQQYKVENEAENARKVYEVKEAFERGEISQDEYFAEIGEVASQERLSDEEIVAKIYENDEQYNALMAQKKGVDRKEAAVVAAGFGALAGLGGTLTLYGILDGSGAFERDGIKAKKKKKHEDLEPENA